MSFGPSLPEDRPGEDSTVEELWKKAGWDNVPLFMNKVPDQRSKPSKLEESSSNNNNSSSTGQKTSTSTNVNPLEALQALIYDVDQEDEQDFLNSLESLKARGNELFVLKDFRQALGFYNQCSDWIKNFHSNNNNNNNIIINLNSDPQDDSNGPSDQKKKRSIPVELERSIFSNRAACHLSLGNYRSCLNDCSRVLKEPLPAQLTNSIIKSFYRSSKALINLERYEDSLKNIENLIEKLKNSKDKKKMNNDDEEEEEKEAKVVVVIDEKKFKEIFELKVEIENRIKDRDNRALKEKLDKEFRINRDKLLTEVLRSRGIIIQDLTNFPPRRSVLPTGLEPVHFEDESRLRELLNNQERLSLEFFNRLEPQISIVYPVYVFRPKEKVPTQDLILNWNEDDQMVDHLINLTRSSSENENEDKGDSLRFRFYLISYKNKVLRCGNQMTFRKIGEKLRSSKSSSSSGGEGGGSDGLKIGIHGQLEIFLLPIGELENEWIEETKKELLLSKK